MRLTTKKETKKVEIRIECNHYAPRMTIFQKREAIKFNHNGKKYSRKQYFEGSFGKKYVKVGDKWYRLAGDDNHTTDAYVEIVGIAW